MFRLKKIVACSLIFFLSAPNVLAQEPTTDHLDALDESVIQSEIERLEVIDLENAEVIEGNSEELPELCTGGNCPTDIQLISNTNVGAGQFAPPDPNAKKITTPQALDPKAFLQSFKGQHNVSLFSGTLSYQYPIWTPKGRKGIEPQLSLNYSGMDTRFTTAVGYGWSLPTNGIYRTPQKGKDTTFYSNDFTADIFGNTQELVLVNASTGEYYAKNESDFIRYIFKSNQWIATNKQGVKYIFGSTASSRQLHSQDASKVYKWMLERVEDVHGNFMTFSYVKFGGAIYPSKIRYTGNGTDQGIFEVRFLLKNRPNYLSYSTAFAVDHYKILDEIQIYNLSGVLPKKIMAYKLDYQQQNDAIHLLKKVTVIAGDGKKLPPTQFDYYSAGKGRRINLLHQIHEPYGAIHSFVYQPSTAYRKSNKASENKIPFVVHTIKEYHLQAGPNEPVYKTAYNYKDGHYYADKRDAFERQYAGFGQVEVLYPDGNQDKYFYHQSENDPNNPAHVKNGEYDDHISKKGRLYRQETWQGSGKKLLTKLNRWDYKKLPAANGNNRYFAYLDTEVSLYEEGLGFIQIKATAKSYAYDAYGNKTLTTDYGEVSVMNQQGGFVDVGSDKITGSITYINDVNKYLLGFISTQLINDQNNKTLSAQLFIYDGLPTGQIAKGNQTKIRVSDGSRYIDTSMDYDARGLLIKSTDPLGNSKMQSYDKYGLNPVKITNAKGHTSQIEYDLSFGTPIKLTDANHISVYTQLDSFGRKVTEQNEIKGVKNIVRKYEYNLSSYPFSLVQKTYPGTSTDDGFTVEGVSYIYFDGLSRPIQNRTKAKEDGGNQFVVTGKAYDGKGQIKKELLPRFEKGGVYNATAISQIGSEYSYDARGRLTQVKTPLGSAITTYQPFGNVVTDVMGNKKGFTQDARGNLIEVKEYLSGKAYSTYYQYNTAGNLIQLKNAVGDLKKITYDDLHRRTSMTLWHKPSSPSQKKWTWTYDDNNNITSSTDARGNKITYSYDGLNRPLKEVSLSQTTVYTYDNSTLGIGRLSQVKTPDVTKNFNYQELGLPADLTVSIKGKSYKSAYQYDWLGNRVQITHPNGEVVQYVFDGSGRIDGIKRLKPTTEIYAYGVQYAPTEAISRITSGNSVETQNTYDISQLYRLTHKKSINHGDSQKLIQDIDYTFDKVGNIIKIQDKGVTKAAYSADYTYDDLYRLTSEKAQSSFANSRTSNYTYDIVGNITSALGSNYTYSHAHPHAVTKIDTKTFQYDDGGNMTSGNGWNHVYNDKNQLVKSTRGSEVVEYAYDEAGNRVWKKELTSGKTTTSYYPNPEYDTEGDVERVKIFIGNQKIASHETDTIKKSNEAYWHHSDHLGSANITTDINSKMVEESNYLAYGIPLSENTTPTYTNDYKYTNKEQDKGTDLYYYGARYYDPSINRFTSIDPWEGDMTDPQSFNKYSYVRNNPIKYVDPTGEAWIDYLVGSAYSPAQDSQPGSLESLIESDQNNPQVSNPISFGLEVAPVAGDINDAYSALMGESAVTGEKLSKGERIGYGAGSMLPLISGRLVNKVVSIFSKTSGKLINDLQKKSLHRFNKKFNKNLDKATVYDLPSGGKAFQKEVPSQNIPGSKAVYEKQVSPKGQTINYTKTTYDKDGAIIHVKDKINNKTTYGSN